jgi:hypothetical protein
MPILIAFLPLIAFGVGVLVGYYVQPEDVSKAAESAYGPEPVQSNKPEKELPKWDNRR